MKIFLHDALFFGFLVIVKGHLCENERKWNINEAVIWLLAYQIKGSDISLSSGK